MATLRHKAACVVMGVLFRSWANIVVSFGAKYLVTHCGKFIA
jgi:hypothetical protein